MLDYIVENDIGYQCNSRNQSFVDFCLRLKRRGINNWAFPLRLNDPKLIGVNPYDVSNQVEKNRVLIECAENPWYFFREVLRIPGNAGCNDQHTRFKANRGNMAVLFDVLIHGISSWITGPRQITGKSTTWISVILWWYIFDTEKRNILIPVRSKAVVDEIVWKMDRIIDALPEYIPQYAMGCCDMNEDSVDRQNKCDVRKYKNLINDNMISFVVLAIRDGEINTLRELIKQVSDSKMRCAIAVDDMECDTIGSRVMDALCNEGGNTQCLFASVPCKSNEYVVLVEDIYERDEILYDRTHAELKTIAGKLPLSVIHTEVDYRMLGKTERWLEFQARKIDEPLFCYRELLCGRDDSIYFSEDCKSLMVKPDPRVSGAPVDVSIDLESVLLLNKSVLLDTTLENIHGLSESHVDLVVDAPTSEDADECGYYFAASRDSGEILTDYLLPEIDYLLSHPAIPDVMWDKYGRTYYIASRHETYRMHVRDQTANK